MVCQEGYSGGNSNNNLGGNYVKVLELVFALHGKMSSPNERTSFLQYICHIWNNFNVLGARNTTWLLL
jgi:hypothetical protein